MLQSYVTTFLSMPENWLISDMDMNDARNNPTILAAVQAQFGKEAFFNVYTYMNGLLDFEESMKNPRAAFFMKSKFIRLPLHSFFRMLIHYGIDVWVAGVHRWLNVEYDLRHGKTWPELSPAFYDWLAHSAKPYPKAPEGTSGNSMFAGVRFSHFTERVLHVVGGRKKKPKVDYNHSFGYVDD